jgi:hypothetical protein
MTFQDMNCKKNNPWTLEDEREHYPCVMEWWCAEAFFTSVEDKKQWNVKVAFTEWFEKTKKIGSISNMTLFDQDTNTHYIQYSRDDSAKLNAEKNVFNVSYDDSFMKGSYPNYIMHFHDPKNEITLDLDYRAESLPHWVAQDITNGWLPMGLGAYRYGFIPKNDLSGALKIRDKTFTIKGTGYFEHVWGDFLYDNPLTNASELKHTLGTYTKLIGWWIYNHKLHIPNSIMFSTENNPFGYDWVWALLDNGWSLFYGNIMFWIMKGPMAGTLILSKDGKAYTEFCNVDFKYNKMRYGKEHDFYYPSELEIIAKNRKEHLHLTFTMTAEAREYISKFSGGSYWIGLVICEAPGTVKGYYFDGERKTDLSGICKIEPQRQLSALGHNSLKLDFLKPPKGVGVDVDFTSHYLKKKITTKLHLAPRPTFKFDVKKLSEEDFSTSML